MQLLQGGTQSDLRSDGELIVPVSELGASVYVLVTDEAKGYCSLTDTVAADITPNGLYICTATQIYFLDRADMSGDSTAQLQLLSITPSADIIALRAEKTFLAYITNQDICIVNLVDLSSRVLTLSNLLFLDTYRDYVAFATASVVYTFSTKADTFSLSNCYTPSTLSVTTHNLELVDELRSYIQVVGENLIIAGGYAFSPMHTTAYFGDYKRITRLYLDKTYRDWNHGWQCFEANRYQMSYVSPEGLNKAIPENNTSTSYILMREKPGYWRNDYTLYTLDPNCKTADLKLLPANEFYMEPDANNGGNFDPDECVYVLARELSGAEEVSVKYFFTLPDESHSSFIRAYVRGWIDTPTMIYFWVGYFHQRDTDDPNTFKEPRMVFCSFDKTTKATTCVQDTYRTAALAQVPEDYTRDLEDYFSDITPMGGMYVLADKVTDTTEWSTSGKTRELKVFSLDEATGDITTLSTTDVIETHLELQHCWIIAGETSFCLHFEYNSNYVYRFDTVTQSTYNVSALTLGPGLAIADNGVGIHYMGLSGHWKRLFPETEEVTAISIGLINARDEKLAYATSTFSKVIDL